MALSNARKEELAIEMAQRKYFDDLQRTRVDMANKHKFDNFNRYLHLQQNELDDEKEVDNKNGNAALRETLVKRDEKLAIEMCKMKQNEMNDMRLRQILRETSPELKELEAKLKAAYLQKELILQMREKEAGKLLEKEKEKIINNKLCEARIIEKEYLRALQEKKIKDSFKYKQELQDQIIFQERTHRAQYEEFLQEKKFIDDLVQRIEEEDQRQEEYKHCKMIQLKNEMEAFHAAQEIWKSKEKEKVAEEERNIQEFIKEKAEVEIQRKIEQDERDAVKAKILENMSKQIYQERRNEEEKREIILELIEEEKKEAMEKKEIERQKKEAQRRVEILASLKSQMLEKQEQQRKEAEEDAAFKEALIAKMERDNKLDLLSNQKRRLKMLQIRKDVENMIIANKEKKAVEMQQKIRLQELEQEELAKRQLVIEEERLRMLKEHTKNLVGFLPPGILREEDLQHLGDDVRNMLRGNSKE